MEIVNRKESNVCSTNRSGKPFPIDFYLTKELEKREKPPTTTNKQFRRPIKITIKLFGNEGFVSSYRIGNCVGGSRFFAAAATDSVVKNKRQISPTTRNFWVFSRAFWAQHKNITKKKERETIKTIWLSYNVFFWLRSTIHKTAARNFGVFLLPFVTTEKLTLSPASLNMDHFFFVVVFNLRWVD